MKAMNTIVKILTALATIAGVVYIIATYGEQIVAWCKKTLTAMSNCPLCKDAEPEIVEEAVEETAEETVADEVPAEEAAEETVEEVAEEAVPEVVVAENEPVAEESDFAE